MLPDEAFQGSGQENLQFSMAMFMARGPHWVGRKPPPEPDITDIHASTLGDAALYGPDGNLTPRQGLAEARSAIIQMGQTVAISLIIDGVSYVVTPYAARAIGWALRNGYKLAKRAGRHVLEKVVNGRVVGRIAIAGAEGEGAGVGLNCRRFTDPNSIPNAARNLVRQAEARYPALAGSTQWHHTWPLEFGPPPNIYWRYWPNTVQLPASYHQVITNEIRAGLRALGPNPTQAQLWELLQRVYTRFPINGFPGRGAGAW